MASNNNPVRVASVEQITDLANTIAQQAEAIRHLNTTADLHAAARLLRSNADTLVAWTLPKKEMV